MIYYGVKRHGSSIEPKLEYVVFDRWEAQGSALSLKRRVLGGSDGWKVTFHKGGIRSTAFPGPQQMAEYCNAERKISDDRITLVEFWSFHEHPDAERTLNGLERYIKDLRKRVAERDAAQSASP